VTYSSEEMAVIIKGALKLEAKNNILLDDLHRKKEHIKSLEVAPVKWREEKAELMKALKHIAAMCGNPNAGDACRLILERIKEMESGK